jgi:hypothetical protein
VGDIYPLGPLGGENLVWAHKPIIPQGHRVVGRTKTIVEMGRPREAMAHVWIVRGVRHDPEEVVRFSRAHRPQTPEMAWN